MNSGSSESDKLPTKLASGTKNEMTIPFCAQFIAAFQFSLKQISEIYAKINSPLGYGIFWAFRDPHVSFNAPNS